MLSEAAQYVHDSVEGLDYPDLLHLQGSLCTVVRHHQDMQQSSTHHAHHP
jgi:hypothetical protein